MNDIRVRAQLILALDPQDWVEKSIECRIGRLFHGLVTGEDFTATTSIGQSSDEETNSPTEIVIDIMALSRLIMAQRLIDMPGLEWVGDE